MFPFSTIVSSFVGDSQCIAAALFFFVGGAFQLIYDQACLDFINDDHEGGFGTLLLEDLDPDMIETETVAMWYYAKYEYVAGISHCIAWVLLATIMVRVAWKFSQGGTTLVGISISLVIVSCAGAFAETIATLMYLGMMRAISWASVSYDLNGWLADSASVSYDDDEVMDDFIQESITGEDGDPFFDDFIQESTTGENGDRFLEEEYGGQGGNDDEYLGVYVDDDEDDDDDEDVYNGLGWKTLETTKGIMLWMTSFEIVFLALLYVITFFAVIRSNMLSKGFAYYGLVLAAISVTELIADSDAFRSSLTSRRFSTVLGSIHRMILLPVWLVWAGRLMRKEELSGTDPDVEIDGSEKQVKEIEINGISVMGTRFS